MSTTTPNPLPDSYRRVTPCLVVQGAAKALEFYAEVFGATERMRFPGPDGRIAHAEIQIGDSVVIVDDESPERGTKAPPPGGLAGSPSSLFIYVEDVDAVVASEAATRCSRTAVATAPRRCPGRARGRAPAPARAADPDGAGASGPPGTPGAYDDLTVRENARYFADHRATVGRRRTVG